MNTKKLSLINLMVISFAVIALASTWVVVKNFALNTPKTDVFQSEEQVIVYPAKAVATARPGALVAALPVSSSVPAPLPLISPKVITRTLPIYPARELEDGIEGTVILRIFVSDLGKPGEIQVKSTSGSAQLDRAASSAISSWTFEPARRGVMAISSWFEIPVRFEIK